MSTIKVNKILSADNPEVDVADGLTVTGEVKVGSAVTSNSTGIDVTGIVTATNFVGVSSITKGDTSAQVIDTGSDGHFKVKTNGEEKLRIDSTGRLLFGQDSAYSVNPAGGVILGVFTKDQANRSDLIVSNQSNADNAGAGIVLASHGQDYIIESTGSGNSTDGAGALSISRSTEERLRIASNGDVEIRKNDDAKIILKGDSVGVGTTTTAGRNAGVSTATGTLIFNSTDGTLQVYNGNTWDTCSNIFSATGGNTTYTQGNYKVHVFTSNGTFVANGSGSVDALVVAGGGGAGQTSRPSWNGAWAGGGGAGGVNYQADHPLTAATYPVVIGAGGATGSNGSPSTFDTITAIGGGRGGGQPYPGPTNQGAPGGSGGGGLGDHPGPSLDAGAGTSGTGYPGGAGIDPGGGPDNYEQGGGGGGAGEAGNTDGNGWGGDGRDMSPQFGTTYGESGVFGGGGAGGAGTSGASYNEGGTGGGGDSGYGHNNNGKDSTAGTANTGGGGGAGSNSSGGQGKPGGSGIVLIRYLVN